MEKKVGKIFFLFLVCFAAYSFASESSITLRMQNIDHRPITQAICKGPFILQVELKNLDSYKDISIRQHVKGIDRFQSSRSMVSHSVVQENGKETTKSVYNFILRSDRKGEFTIGPIALNDGTGNIIESNKLKIIVGDEIVFADGIKNDKFFTDIRSNKSSVYCGEKFQLTIDFYDRIFVENLYLQFPDFKDFYVIKNQNNVKKSSVVLENQEYSVTTWTFDMYATQTGPLMIDDINAIFFAPEPEKKFRFNGPFDLFRTLHKTQQYITVKPLPLEVLPLPESKEYTDVIAVGKAVDYKISINQQSAQAGQGIVLNVDIVGDLNFEMLPSPTLALPDSFKYYDSNIVTIDKNRTYKRFEFIVQANEPGNYHIPPQSFVYFDYKNGQYKTIQSNSFDILINPADTQISSTYEPEQVVDEPFQDIFPAEKQLQDFTIIEKGLIHQQSVIIPLSVYKKITWLVWLCWLVSFFYMLGIKKYLLKNPRIKKLVVFSQAKRACKKALLKNNPAGLHALFIKLFSQLLDVHPWQINRTMIEHYLQKSNFSIAHIKSWNIFYEKILQASFSSETVTNGKDIGKQALAWIQLLKETV